MQRLDQEYVGSLKRNQVLALDIAEHTGVFGTYFQGTVYFPVNDSKDAKKYGSDYDQHQRFGNWLKKTIVDNEYKVVAVEDLNVSKNFMAVKKLAEMRGILLYICAELNIPVVFFNVRSIKKWATGDGNADKKKMIEYCEKRWHYICQDDNEADACHIYFYFLKRYNL